MAGAPATAQRKRRPPCVRWGMAPAVEYASLNPRGVAVGAFKAKPPGLIGAEFLHRSPMPARPPMPAGVGEHAKGVFAAK
jgi:hypothetical protein